jgi:hypothetical protein
MNPVQANNEDDPLQGTADGWLRERDDELPAELWEERTGHMVRPCMKRPSARAQADAIVAAALREKATAGLMTHLTHKWP